MTREIKVGMLSPSMACDYTIGVESGPRWYNLARYGEESPLLLPEIQMEDVVRLKKPHPCGSTDWVVVRLGADIGIRCLGCGRRVLLTRRELSKRMKGYVVEQAQGDG